MDSTAANYDPLATSNTNSRCVPAVRGCMLPSYTVSGNLLAIGRDYNSASSFNPAATVHVNSTCTADRRGCTSPTALNYDQHASIPDTCYEPVGGCLNQRALNFNCTAWEGQFSECTDDSPRATVHVEYLCNYQVAPPPMPLPGLPPGASATYYLTYTFASTGDVSDITQTVIDAVRQRFAVETGLDLSQVSVSVESASIMWNVEVTTPDGQTAAAAESALSDEMSSAASANQFLSATGAPTVTTTPRSSVRYGALADTPSQPPSADIGPVIGISIGGVFTRSTWWGSYTSTSSGDRAPRSSRLRPSSTANEVVYS